MTWHFTSPQASVVARVLADGGTESRLATTLDPQGLAAVAAFEPPPPTAADLTAEYRRRLLILLGADSLAHAAFIAANDEVELRQLRELAEPTADQAARIADLVARAGATAALIERYNAIDALAPLPADYASDSRWS